jgi:hypothetical protein
MGLLLCVDVHLLSQHLNMACGRSFNFFQTVWVKGMSDGGIQEQFNQP